MTFWDEIELAGFKRNQPCSELNRSIASLICSLAFMQEKIIAYNTASTAFSLDYRPKQTYLFSETEFVGLDEKCKYYFFFLETKM